MTDRLPALQHPASLLPTFSIRLLEAWYRSMKQWLYPYPSSSSSESLAYFGTGDHSSWGVQASATAFAGLAALATSPDLNEKAAGATKEQITSEALAILRFLLTTHISGAEPGPSKIPWGHSWISILGYSRIFHSIKQLDAVLSPDDRDGLRRVMLSEANFLLTGYPVVGAIDASTGNNKPESNIWNGAFLCRAASLYPDTPYANAYQEQGRRLLLNGISVPSDSTSDFCYSGIPLKQWHVGPNFTDNYGLHHHSYLNVGYMVICLSNIAMAHYAFEDDGLEPPAELYHHAFDLWKVVKTFTFDDGRLWRIGGDTRVRYCYCQDYAIAAWLLALDLWGDPDAGRFLERWIDQVALEQEHNADGSFLGGRLRELANLSPLYYCRLEGDRAASLSMAACWATRIVARQASQPMPPPEPESGWHDEFHGAAAVRGNRFASWTWKAAQGPLGTMVPADMSNLAEWEWNLAGKIVAGGGITKSEGDDWRLDTFPGGFITSGQINYIEEHNLAEGRTPTRIATSQLLFLALPDDSTILVLQRAKTTRPTHLKEYAGLGLKIPNDLHNKSQRSYWLNESELILRGADVCTIPDRAVLPAGRTLCIDGRITVAALYGGALSLQRPGRRQITLANPLLQHSGQGGSLHCDEIVLSASLAPSFQQGGDLLYDIGALVSIDGSPSAHILDYASPHVRLIEITAQDGRAYLLAVNFGPAELRVSVPLRVAGAKCLAGAALNTPSKGSPPSIALPENGGYSLLRLED